MERKTASCAVQAVNTLRVPMIVCGFGVWLSSSLIHMHSMAAIHIQHRIPLAFVLKLPLCLIPWFIACGVLEAGSGRLVAVVLLALCAVLCTSRASSSFEQFITGI